MSRNYSVKAENFEPFIKHEINCAADYIACFPSEDSAKASARFSNYKHNGFITPTTPHRLTPRTLKTLEYSKTRIEQQSINAQKRLEAKQQRIEARQEKEAQKLLTKKPRGRPPGSFKAKTATDTDPSPAPKPKTIIKTAADRRFPTSILVIVQNAIRTPQDFAECTTTMFSSNIDAIAYFTELQRYGHIYKERNCKYYAITPHCVRTLAHYERNNFPELVAEIRPYISEHRKQATTRIITDRTILTTLSKHTFKRLSEVVATLEQLDNTPVDIEHVRERIAHFKTEKLIDLKTPRRLTAKGAFTLSMLKAHEEQPDNPYDYSINFEDIYTA